MGFSVKRRLNEMYLACAFSRAQSQLAKLKRDGANYRSVFVQPRQKTCSSSLGDKPEDKRAELRIDLSPGLFLDQTNNGSTEPLRQ